MKKLYLSLLGVTLALLLGVGVWSLFGSGEQVSSVDGKTLAERPEFSFAALLTAAICRSLKITTAIISRCATRF